METSKTQTVVYEARLTEEMKTVHGTFEVGHTVLKRNYPFSIKNEVWFKPWKGSGYLLIAPPEIIKVYKVTRIHEVHVEELK